MQAADTLLLAGDGCGAVHALILGWEEEGKSRNGEMTRCHCFYNERMMFTVDLAKEMAILALSAGTKDFLV